jgi:hypothetical protein
VSFANANTATANAAANLPPVIQACDSLARSQAGTHELLDRLTQRLEAILAPDSPKTGTGPQPVACGQSPLHSNLIDRCEASESHNARLSILLDRLTV